MIVIMIVMDLLVGRRFPLFVVDEFPLQCGFSLLGGEGRKDE